MSTIVCIDDRSSNEYRILSKGAPEVIKTFLSVVPPNYDSCYLKHVKNGARVLALAYKILPRQPAETYASIKREEAESELTFCGFLVSECPLKLDTKRVVKELKEASH
jgi:cation-transporting ATPase 13A1